MKKLPENFKGMIESLERMLPINRASQLLSLMNSNSFTESDFEPYLDYNHPDDACYGRSLVYQGEYFEVMVMSWNPGDFSAIHDHGHIDWGIVKLFGEAEHNVFRYEENYLEIVKSERLQAGALKYVSPKIIHQLGNNSDKPFYTLHIYGSNNKANTITANSRVFQLDKGQIYLTDGGAFYNLSAEHINDIAPLGEVEEGTLAYHNYRLDRFTSGQNSINQELLA